MRRNKSLLIGGLAFLGLCAGLASAMWFEQNSQVKAGRVETAENRPEFELPDLDGTVHSIREWDGSVIVLNFWATWCPPCRKEIPEFVAMQSELADQGVQFIGVAIDDEASVREFMLAQPFNYPNLMGGMSGVALSQRYGNDVGALPYSVVINRARQIIFRRAGPLHGEQLRSILEPLLQAKS